MKILHHLLIFFALFLFDTYLKNNISGINKGSLSLLILLFFLVFAGIVFLWRIIGIKSILIRRSFFLLLLFFAYYAFRIGVDIGSIERLKAYTFSTSGGIILFYSLGFVVSVILGDNFKHPKSQLKSYLFFVIIYFLFSYLSLLNVFIELNYQLREDFFLISGVNDAYQRPGNFLIIGYLVLLSVYGHFISINKTLVYGYNKIISFFMFSVLLLYTITSMLIAQAIGSNAATVTIAGLSFIAIGIVIALWLTSLKKNLLYRPLSFWQLYFGIIGLKLMLFGLISAVLVVLAVLALSSYIGIDLSMTRLGGFGSGEISSISSRISLLDNFIIQLSYSPIFGNMNVDCLTTGCGSYVHSFLVTTLSFTGFIGFFTLLGYFILAYKERVIIFNSPGGMLMLDSNIYNLFSILIFSGVLFVAIVSTNLVWIPIWFAMGLFFNAVVFKIR
jgi:hypothetical protein